jgi:hypothetical protein
VNKNILGAQSATAVATAGNVEQGQLSHAAWSVPSNLEGTDARWLDAYFACQLANVTALHIYGVPLLQLKPQLRADIRDFAESYVEDAVTRYGGILNAKE